MHTDEIHRQDRQVDFTAEETEGTETTEGISFPQISPIPPISGTEIEELCAHGPERRDLRPFGKGIH
ncbi:MAG: hypothetical protein ACREJQ_03890 [bacterium]